jgi:hypothetical protein
MYRAPVSVRDLSDPQVRAVLSDGQYEQVCNELELLEGAGVRCKDIGIYTGYYFWIDNTNRGTQAPSQTEAYSYYAPTTYDLFYQVSTYSRHPRHDRSIMFSMLNEKIPGKYGHLLIPQANGVGTVARHMFLEGFVKRDSVEDGRRLLRNVFSIRVVSEMTPNQVAQATALVETVNLETTPATIPSGFESV